MKQRVCGSASHHPRRIAKIELDLAGGQTRTHGRARENDHGKESDHDRFGRIGYVETGTKVRLTIETQM